MAKEYRIKEASTILNNGEKFTVFYPQVKVVKVEMVRTGIFSKKEAKEVTEWHSFYKYFKLGSIYPFLIKIDIDYELIKTSSIDEAKNYINKYENQYIESAKKQLSNTMYTWDVCDSVIVHPLNADDINLPISGVKNDSPPPSFNLQGDATQCLKELIEVYHNCDSEGQPKASIIEIVDLWKKAQSIVKSNENVINLIKCSNGLK